MNRGIATYLFGGTELLKLYLSNVKQFGDPLMQEKALTKIVTRCAEQRQLIRQRQEMDIHTWVEKWKGEDYERG